MALVLLALMLWAIVKKYADYKVVNLDKLTYAGNLLNLSDIENEKNYEFIKGDIVDSNFINNIFLKYKFDGIIHLAAKSHVDRSIVSPMDFIMTNIVGTVNLLNAVKTIWKDNSDNKKFYHISTDEVYGSLSHEGFFTEKPLTTAQSLFRFKGKFRPYCKGLFSHI